MRKPGRWRLSAEMATQEIRKRAAISANVLLTLHAQEQMVAKLWSEPEFSVFAAENVKISTK